VREKYSFFTEKIRLKRQAKISVILREGIGSPRQKAMHMPNGMTEREYNAAHRFLLFQFFFLVWERFFRTRLNLFNYYYKISLAVIFV
jgi:hypothetical protein